MNFVNLQGFHSGKSSWQDLSVKSAAEGYLADENWDILQVHSHRRRHSIRGSRYVFQKRQRISRFPAY